jgi:hypothetical protein
MPTDPRKLGETIHRAIRDSSRTYANTHGHRQLPNGLQALITATGILLDESEIVYATAKLEDGHFTAHLFTDRLLITATAPSLDENSDVSAKAVPLSAIHAIEVKETDSILSFTFAEEWPGRFKAVLTTKDESFSIPLDEPSNYGQREKLAALVTSIRDRLAA